LYDSPSSFLPSPDNIHRFWLYRLKAINIYVIHKIRNMLFLDNVVAYHSPGFCSMAIDQPLSSAARVAPGWNCINVKTYIKLEPIATLNRFRLAVQSPFLLERRGGLIGEERVETFILIYLHEER
jgi:hypothetical protein